MLRSNYIIFPSFPVMYLVFRVYLPSKIHSRSILGEKRVWILTSYAGFQSSFSTCVNKNIIHHIKECQGSEMGFFVNKKKNSFISLWGEAVWKILERAISKAVVLWFWCYLFAFKCSPFIHNAESGKLSPTDNGRDLLLCGAAHVREVMY